MKCSTGISIERKMKKPLTTKWSNTRGYRKIKPKIIPSSEDILLKHGHYINTETGVVFVIPNLKDLIKELEGVK